jgi:ribonuclease HI
MIKVWVDGSNDNYNTKIAAVGIVAKYKGKTITIGKHIGTATNNQAELIAILVALRKLKTRYRDIPVTVYSDSQYAIRAVTGQFRKIKANAELIKEVQAEVKNFQHVQFQWVKGHADCAEHNQADRIARKYFRQMKKIHMEKQEMEKHLSDIMNEK